MQIATSNFLLVGAIAAAGIVSAAPVLKGSVALEGRALPRLPPVIASEHLGLLPKETQTEVAAHSSAFAHDTGLNAFKVTQVLEEQKHVVGLGHHPDGSIKPYLFKWNADGTRMWYPHAVFTGRTTPKELHLFEGSHATEPHSPTSHEHSSHPSTHSQQLQHFPEHVVHVQMRRPPGYYDVPTNLKLF
ncbi:hypothetical protein CBOM_01334 [Ceraceosorus bombacis]|uniref:Uncharacterized protein n=1 Tax=Ceraceosorus bombacis TaxID=401625 RepID=A0A0P1BBP2_9BASI|nr:hypothetical protein CBOM_01334 [Ceraceosorus bombacis]